MKTRMRLSLLLLILSPYGYGQTAQTKNGNELSTSALNYKVAHFDLTDSTLIEALSKLSLEPIVGLHLGIEVVLRENFSEPTDRSIRFSLNGITRDCCQVPESGGSRNVATDKG